MSIDAVIFATTDGLHLKMSESEYRRREVSDNVPLITDHSKSLEPLSDSLVGESPYNSRRAESKAVYNDIGSVILAIFVAEKSESGTVAVAVDADVSDLGIHYSFLQIRLYDLPYLEEASVSIPLVLHIPIRLGREVEVVFPIGQSVGLLKKDV